jgi:hypothetical protein
MPILDMMVSRTESFTSFTPESRRGREWLADMFGLDDWRRENGGSELVKAEYTDRVVEAMREYGLTVATQEELTTPGWAKEHGITHEEPGGRPIEVEDQGITPEEELEMIRKGVVAPPGKRAAAQLPAGQPPYPEGEPAADVRADPWGLLSDVIGQPADDKPESTPKRPLKHTIEPEIPGGPYHMTGAEKKASTGHNCEFVEWRPGQWYYVLEDYGSSKDMWDWRENARAYGPFDSEEEAHRHLADNHPNPGGSSTVRYSPELGKDKVLQGLMSKAEKGGTNFVSWASKKAKDAYCDACDRPESQCICSPCDCDLTRTAHGAPGHGYRRPYSEMLLEAQVRAKRLHRPVGVFEHPDGFHVQDVDLGSEMPSNMVALAYPSGRTIGPESLKQANTKPIVGAAEAAEDNMAKKSSREALREKVAEMAKERRAREYGRMREVAAKEPKKVADAIGELSQSLQVMGSSLSYLRENLDLAVPRSASLRERIASRKRYAAEFRRLAEEDPDKIADAIVELYRSLDEIAAGVENLASNLGVELPEPGEDEGLPEEGAGTKGGAAEEPEYQKKEGEDGHEGTAGDDGKEIKEIIGKEATGSAGFVTDRDQKAEPKGVEKAEIPQSQGEAAVKPS